MSGEAEARLTRSERGRAYVLCPLPRCPCAHAAHRRIRSSICPNCGHDLMVQSSEARAWLAGWQAGYDDYDQGTDTPNPYAAALRAAAGTPTHHTTEEDA